MVAWFKEVRDGMQKMEGDQICKTWRLVKYGKAEESQGRVLPIFWFLIWVTERCLCPANRTILAP